MRTVVVAESALEDLAATWLFYENKEPGAGDYFERSVKSEISSLIRLHGIHRVAFGFRRMSMARFPYAICYQEGDPVTRVVAVLDARRDPEWIRNQLRDR